MSFFRRLHDLRAELQRRAELPAERVALEDREYIQKWVRLCGKCSRKFIGKPTANGVKGTRCEKCNPRFHKPGAIRHKPKRSRLCDVCKKRDLRDARRRKCNVCRAAEMRKRRRAAKFRPK